MSSFKLTKVFFTCKLHSSATDKTMKFNDRLTEAPNTPNIFRQISVHKLQNAVSSMPACLYRPRISVAADFNLIHAERVTAELRTQCAYYLA